MAVVINCMHVSHTDFTAAESFHAMIELSSRADRYS